VLFAINNLREGFSSYYKARGVFGKRSRGRGSYYNKRGGGAFISTSSNRFYPDS